MTRFSAQLNRSFTHPHPRKSRKYQHIFEYRLLSFYAVDYCTNALCIKDGVKIDPPYNTGNDFVYADDFMHSQDEENHQMGMFDDDENRLFKNTDSNGRFHSDWCSMMYSRLMLARNLLTDDGVIFISIDDNEQENLKKMCDEVFGASNFIAQIIWEKRYTRSNNAKMFASLTDYILLYRKSGKLTLLRESRNEKNDSIYTNPDNDPRGPWTSVSYVNPASRDQRPNLCYEIINPYTGEKVSHPIKCLEI